MKVPRTAEAPRTVETPPPDTAPGEVAEPLRAGVFWSGVRGRLFLLLALLAVPVALVLILGTWSDLRGDLAERKNEVNRLGAHAQGDFETLLADTDAVFDDLLRLNEMRRSNNCTQIYPALRLAFERLAPEATNIVLSDAAGDLYCAVAPVLGERNLADRPQFQRAVKGLELAVGAYTLDPSSGSPSLQIAYPVLSFDGQVQTVVFVTFELAWLDAWQNEVTLPPGAALTLLAPDGTELQHRLDGIVVPAGRPHGALLTGSQALQLGEVVEATGPDGERRLHTLVPLSLGSQTAAYLHLGYPVAELYAGVNRSLRWKLASLGLTLLAGLAVAGWGSERLFFQPLRRLMGVVGRVQAGDLQARAVAVDGLSELARLAQAFDRMADALLQRETARQRAQAELQESEERFRAVLDNAAVGVAVMTLDRHIVQINQTASRLTGYSADELKEVNPSLLAVEEDRLLDRDLFIELVEGRRDQYSVEKRYIRKDGRIFWGRVNFSAVKGPDGKPLYTIGMIEDISEERQSAEKLAAQEAEYRLQLEQRIAERTLELKEANELLSQKAAQDAVTAERTRLARELHDAVTQTLFSAALIAEVLPELWEINEVEGRRRLAELHQLSRGALAEMRALLVELRPNALVEGSLPTLLRQLTEAVTGRARINVQLSVDGQRKLPAEVQVALYRIAQEALNNIVKHSKATQAMVTLRLAGPVRLTVADNGAGFDPEIVTTDHLGLKIMRERAEAIGAKFSLYSEPGEGAQISVLWDPGETV